MSDETLCPYREHRKAIRAIMNAHYGKKLPGQPFLPSSVRVGPFTAPGEVRVPPNVAGPYTVNLRGVSESDVITSHSDISAGHQESAA